MPPPSLIACDAASIAGCPRRGPQGQPAAHEPASTASDAGLVGRRRAPAEQCVVALHPQPGVHHTLGCSAPDNNVKLQVKETCEGFIKMKTKVYGTPIKICKMGSKWAIDKKNAFE